MNKKILVFDATSLLYPTFFASKGSEDEITKAGLALHHAFTTFYKYYKKYRPSTIVAAFDRPSWRKKMTKEDDAFNFIYKGSRRKNMTPAEMKKFQAFIDHIGEFEEILDNHTGIVTLSANGAEGDDFVARMSQLYGEDNEVICITGDSDLAQLHNKGNVTVIETRTGKPFNLKKYNDDPDYYLFVKCFRGDSSDDIPSAFPRIREKRLRSAFYEDAVEFANIMKDKYMLAGEEIKVVDRYAQNKMLIDLTCQPDYVIEIMDQIIKEKMENPGQYSHFQFGKHCAKMGLEKLRTNLITYAEMLS